MSVVLDRKDVLILRFAIETVCSHMYVDPKNRLNFEIVRIKTTVSSWWYSSIKPYLGKWDEFIINYQIALLFALLINYFTFYYSLVQLFIIIFL